MPNRYKEAFFVLAVVTAIVSAILWTCGVYVPCFPCLRGGK